MEEAQIDYSVSQYDNILVIKIHEPRLESGNAPAFKTELLRLIAGGSKNILLNLKEVITIDSSGLGALTFGKRQLDEINGELSVCCLKERVFRLFRIAKLDRVISIYETENEGLQRSRTN